MLYWNQTKDRLADKSLSFLLHVYQQHLHTFGADEGVTEISLLQEIFLGEPYLFGEVVVGHGRAAQRFRQTILRLRELRGSGAPELYVHEAIEIAARKAGQRLHKDVGGSAHVSTSKMP